MTCWLHIVDGQSSLDLKTDLLSLAQKINTDIHTNTVMWDSGLGWQRRKRGDV